MEMMFIIVALALAATLKGVQAVITHDVGDLCASTHAPTIPLPPATLILNFTTSLTLSRACVIHFTAEYNLRHVDVTTKPDRLKGVSFPCNWLSVVYGWKWHVKVPSPYHKYACPLTQLHPASWSVDDIDKHPFTIIVNATTGIERDGDFSLVLTKYYRPCTNFSNGRPVDYCCHHGVNDSLADYAVCDALGIYRCLRREMFCDGVVNCIHAQDEEGCVANVTVASGGVAVGVGVWAVVGVWSWLVEAVVEVWW